MAYTFSSLKTQLQNEVGDPNLDDDLAGYAINQAQQAIFNEYDLTLNSDTQTNAVASGANTLTSALPDDLQRIKGLYITSPSSRAKSLKPYYTDPDDFREHFPDAGTNTGALGHWATFNGTVEFAVKSDTDVTVKVDYIKSVPILTATTDVPVVPEAFKELLMIGSKMRVFEGKEDFDYAGQYTNRYADLLEAFSRRYSTRQVDVQSVVKGARNRVVWR